MAPKKACVSIAASRLGFYWFAIFIPEADASGYVSCAASRLDFY